MAVGRSSKMIMNVICIVLSNLSPAVGTQYPVQDWHIDSINISKMLVDEVI